MRQFSVLSYNEDVNALRAVGDHPFFVIGNKADTLPKTAKWTRIEQWIRDRRLQSLKR